MRMKYLAAACGVALATMASTPAFAAEELAGVLAGSDVGLQFKPGTISDPGGLSGFVNFSGAVISGSVGSTSFGSGASYASTSQIDDSIIYFKNGNASSGQFTYSKSTTLVDITFTNTGNGPVTPFLISQIVPAGFGLFVGPNGCSENPEGCNPADVTPGNFNSFNPVTAGGVPTLDGISPDLLAFASVRFRIYTNTGESEFVAYDLTGTLSLTYGGGFGEDNILLASISPELAGLNGFKLDSPPISENSDFLGYIWDTTDIDVIFPSDLAAGEQATLRYETIVETYSRSSCLSENTSSCLVSYASFGDPVSRRVGGTAGRGLGDSMKGFGSLTNETPSGIFFDEFAFRAPVFNPETGGLTFELIGRVPEPDSWALMIAGFGLVGASMRQRRRLAA
jgi:hypothetical protein